MVSWQPTSHALFPHHQTLENIEFTSYLSYTLLAKQQHTWSGYTSKDCSSRLENNGQKLLPRNIQKKGTQTACTLQIVISQENILSIPKGL